jgi:hypothetical protein
MEVRRFDKHDWDGFAGAEPFRDGTDPFICDGAKFVAIADVQGINVICGKSLEGHGGGWLKGWEFSAPEIAKAALFGVCAMLDLLERADDPGAYSEVLSQLGFEEC